MNNLETKIEMKEDPENDLTEDEDASDEVKNDSKSSHVYLTQPSDDLNQGHTTTIFGRISVRKKI